MHGLRFGLLTAIAAVASCAPRPAPSLGKVAFKRTSLQGITIDLPVGKVMTDVTDRSQGKHSINVGVDGTVVANVALSWERGAGVTEAQARARAQIRVDYAAEELKLDGAGIASAHKVQASDRTAFVVVGHVGTYHSVLAMWHCQGDDRNFALQVLTQQPVEPAVRIADRMAGSVECHIEDAPPPTHPKSVVGFDGDLSVGMKAVANGFAYVTRDAELMIAKKAPKGTAASIAKRPEILAKEVSGINGLAKLTYDPDPVTVDGAAGRLTAHTGRLTTGGKPLRIVTAGIPCFGTDILLFAMKAGDPDPLGAMPLVRAARCPKPGDTEPGDAAAIAGRSAVVARLRLVPA